jgi:long-chain acyl-CoA synthetase
MDFQRLFDLLPYQALRFPNERALGFKQDGQWRFFSTADCVAQQHAMSAAALRMGLKPGDRAAVIARQGSPYWNFVDLGLQQIGIIVVPLHATSGLDELRYILEHAQIRAVFAGNEDLFHNIQGLNAQLKSLEWVIPFFPIAQVNPCLLDLLQTPSEAEMAQIKSISDRILPKNLATIIYTSGTTGKPKGVMLSHYNIVCNIKSTITLAPVNWEKRALSFLPLSHIFERMITYVYMAVGASLAYAENQDQLLRNLQEIKPHFFTAVPLLIERIYERINTALQRGPLVKRKIFNWAVNLGKHYRDGKRQPWPYWFKLSLARLLVFRHWRKGFGGQIEGISVGAAALSPELGRLFSAARLPIREGYGLTETSPVIAFNRFEPGGVRFGTVGMPIPGVQVRIFEPDEEGEGEVQIKGPNVMLGYYQQEEASKEVFTEDGWFRTGDVGSWMGKHFLKISGRRDDLFKTGAGKFIVPEVIERHMLQSPYIAQCLITGANRPAPSILLIPNFVELEAWCKAHKIHWTGPQFMVLNHKVIAFFREELKRLNQSLPPYQHVQHLLLLHEPWTEDSGEMTPTLKLRRKLIISKHEKAILQLYV